MKVVDKFLEKFVLSKKQVMFALTLIMVMSFMFRVYGLDHESLWHDEALTINVAEKTITGIIDSSYYDSHPPLDYIIFHFWIKIFGDSESSTRCLSVIFGVLSVYFIYRVGELLFNKEIGILSSFILSISLYSIKYSQEVRSYSLLILLILLSNYCFIKILKEKDSKNINIKSKNVIGYIIFATAAIYIHLFGLFYIIFQNIYYLFVSKKDIRTWVTAQFAILVLFSPWIPGMVRQMTGYVNTNALYIPRPGIGDIYNIFKLFSGNDVSLVIFAVIIIVGLIIFNRHEQLMSYKYEKVFVLMWLFVPILLGFIISQFYQPIFSDRYFIASLPALILLVSYGLFNFQKPILISALLLSIVVVNIPSMNDYYQNVHKEQWRDVAKYIDNNMKDGDIILLYPGYGMYGFDYYYKGGNVYTINGSYEIKNQITRNPGVWLVGSEWWNPYTVEEMKQVERELSKTYARDSYTKFIDINVGYYKKLDPNINVLYLYQKDPKNWAIIKNGSWGMMSYDLRNSPLNFTFEGYDLSPNKDYTLIYTNRSNPTNDYWTYIAKKISDNNGYINLKGYSDMCSSGGIPQRIIVRLVLSDDYDKSNQSMIKWDFMKNYLFENDAIICNTGYDMTNRTGIYNETGIDNGTGIVVSGTGIVNGTT